MSDSEKPKLGMRAPLGLKRTVETGKVKQSFSHGRSNTVVVEVKKRRILGRPGEAGPPAQAPKPQRRSTEAPAPRACADSAPARRRPPPSARARHDDALPREELQTNAAARGRGERACTSARGSAPPRRALEGRGRAKRREAAAPRKIAAPRKKAARRVEAEAASRSRLNQPPRGRVDEPLRRAEAVEEERRAGAPPPPPAHRRSLAEARRADQYARPRPRRRPPPVAAS